ncbi:hypothetical protein BVC80_1739g14 [Macleaya cordata]|uniref:Uncharacterized protein n=1 Tax=Macleaya cordata TaxID=56857 RepID=A0A200Q7Q9_MACCD|nr:hypothetical protein BVC80_1739g14 [Macleaya cordata]
MPNSLLTLLHAWKPKGLPKKGKMLWRFLPTAICWRIWKARNRVAFKGKEVKMEGLINDIKVQVFFWVQGYDEFKGLSIDHIVGRWPDLFIGR